jgi:nicotinamidase-related amidase
MLRLAPETSLLVLVDLQERLAAAMTGEARARVEKTARILLEAARLLGVKTLATEQYPKGLGPTVPQVAELLRGLGVQPIEKLDFCACDEPVFSSAVEASRAKSVVLLGMETHICVFQTARELAARGLDVHVVADGCASRAEENRAAGLALAAKAGATITVAETVVFDWLGRAGSEEFKQISRLVR